MKNRKHWDQRKIYLKDCLHVNRTLGELMKEGSANINYMTPVAASRVTAEIRSRIKYLMPSDNITVLVWHFGLTKKCNLTARCNNDLIRFDDRLHQRHALDKLLWSRCTRHGVAAFFFCKCLTGSVTITTWSGTDGATTCLVWIYLDT